MDKFLISTFFSNYLKPFPVKRHTMNFLLNIKKNCKVDKHRRGLKWSESFVIYSNFPSSSLLSCHPTISDHLPVPKVIKKPFLWKWTTRYNKIRPNQIKPEKAIFLKITNFSFTLFYHAVYIKFVWCVIKVSSHFPIVAQ